MQTAAAVRMETKAKAPRSRTFHDIFEQGLKAPMQETAALQWFSQ
jgi:hypothetical protein